MEPHKGGMFSLSKPRNNQPENITSQKLRFMAPEKSWYSLRLAARKNHIHPREVSILQTMQPLGVRITLASPVLSLTCRLEPPAWYPTS